MTTYSYDIWVLDGQGERVRRTVTEDVPVAEENQVVLRRRAGEAIESNIAFLALPSPTNAQVLAQVRLLTRESTALIRMVLGLLDSMDGA